MRTYQIHLITAGQSKEMLEGKYIGHTDTSLSTQSSDELSTLKELYVYPKATAVFSSPLKRSIETAKNIYPDLSPMVVDDLIEYNFGEFENNTAEQLQDNELFAKWLAGEPDVTLPFGESNNEFAKRIHNCFIMLIDGIIKSGVNHPAIVTHGGIIMAVLSSFGLPEAPMHEWRSKTGTGYTIRVTPELWQRAQKFEVIAKIPYKEDELAMLNQDDDFDYFNVEIEE